MNEEQNKATVAKFFELTNARDYDAAMALLDDQLVWWIAGDPELFFMAGSKSKKEVDQGLRQTATLSPKGMLLTPTSWVAEGNKVAFEATVEGEFANGDRYYNEFHFVCELRDNKILHVKEYFDTETANKVFTKAIGELTGSANE